MACLIILNMKKIFVFLICFASVFTCFGCKKKDNLEILGKNNTVYSIEIDLDVEQKSAKVVQTIDFINNTNSILKVLKLNLYPQFFEEGATHNVISSTKLANTYPNGMSYAKFDIDRVLVKGVDIPVLYSGEYEEILNVDLGSSLMPNERVELGIEYSFQMPNCNHRFGYGENTINLGNFYPIMCVYESGSFVENGYSPNGDPFYSDMANYIVSISVPNEYIVASTGVKQSENTIENKKIVTYKATMVRDFAMVVSDKFQVKSKKVDKVDVLYYYFEDINSDQSLQAGIDSINTFSKLFGKYPYQTYSVVQTDFIHGGMEYPNLVMISADIENSDDYKNVIVHETAHQWWYGIVGNDEMKNPWLDEALTEFSTVLFYDENEGYNLTHEKMIKASKENYSLFVTVYQDVLGKIDTSMRDCKSYSTEPEYTYCTYVKGVLMFDSLYHLVGKDKFIKSLKTYFEQCKYKNATPKDLILAFEETCKTNATNFFDSWISGKVVIR